MKINIDCSETKEKNSSPNPAGFNGKESGVIVPAN